MTPTEVRTYGGWRRARGIGLFGLDATATLTVLASVTSLVLLASLSLRAAAWAAIPATAFVAVTVLTLDGTPVSRTAGRRLRWTWGQAAGHTRYRSVALAGREGAWDLPGVLAPTRLLTATDPRGRDYALVWNRRTGHLTATLDCAAASAWLADAAEAEGWVSAWHAWLASLGYLPMVRAVAVTVECAPEPGTALRDAVAARLDPRAPSDVRALLGELVVRSPAAAADVATRVSITVDPAASAQRLRSLDDAAAETGRVLAGPESALAGCGVTVLGRARSAQVAGWVRAAFDPAARGEVQRVLAARDEVLDTLLTWSEAGPAGADERWDSYRHDSGLSTTWGLVEAPRQQVTAGVLTRLLAPGRFARRVTLVYRPLPAGQAARLLEGQVTATAFREAYRRTQRRDPSARDLADAVQAHRAAAEEAQGAGVVLFTAYVTTTVDGGQDLDEAVADVEARADQSKLRLRRLDGSQAAGFAATLPCGVLPGLLAARGGRR